MKKKTLMFLFFFASLKLKAQEPASINLSEKDGLQDKEFYNIIEDDKDFIWLGAY